MPMAHICARELVQPAHAVVDATRAPPSLVPVRRVCVAAARPPTAPNPNSEQSSSHLCQPANVIRMCTQEIFI